MTGPVDELIEQALDVYADDPLAREQLGEYRTRLREPLRVGVAGMVKAGKSTLLNAIIGEEIAPTDTGECTKVVTWYRYADTPRVTLHQVDGKARSLPVRRADGKLSLDLGSTTADEVSRLVVDWPAKGLRQMTLIDTPGIASLSRDVSARSRAFLTPEDTPSQADAVIYLMRHLHAADLEFLDAFHDTEVGRSGTVNAIAVLSRADEIGAGRIDSMVSARDIAARYRRDPTLRSLALGVIPMAGLLAQSARTLREAEYAAFVELAQLERREREALLVSADRFLRPDERLRSDPELRAALLNRFGLFGIRLAAALLRGGIAESTTLAHELAARSGLGELLKLVDAQFGTRAAELKERTALMGVERLLRERARPGSERLAVGLERILASAHSFRELRLLAAARTEGLPLSRELAAEAEQLLGGEGTTPARRLGMPDDADPAQMHAEAGGRLRRWRMLAENPLTDRAAREICQVVIRSIEGILAQGAELAGSRPALRLATAAEPSARSRQEAEDQRHTG
ncbi:MAG: dynamin family protein [Actinomycetota bacterium]|nr:dynamin family protein [Actinomycetota bacterium]